MILPVVFASLIAIAHFGSDHLARIGEEYEEIAMSLVAGVATVYVFLNLYPEFYRQATGVTPLVFSSVFLGFALFNVIDKTIYTTWRSHIRDHVRVAHGYGLILYYFVVGVVLVKLFNVSTKEGVLFFIPVFTYSALSAISQHNIHRSHSTTSKELDKLNHIQSLAIVLGTLVAIVTTLPPSISLYLIGLVAGILTYIVVRDILPSGRQGRPAFYVLGAFAYAGFIIFLWYV